MSSSEGLWQSATIPRLDKPCASFTRFTLPPGLMERLIPTLRTTPELHDALRHLQERYQEQVKIRNSKPKTPSLGFDELPDSAFIRPKDLLAERVVPFSRSSLYVWCRVENHRPVCIFFHYVTFFAKLHSHSDPFKSVSQ